ncbi:MAG: hypothetical protein PHW83_11595 [Bacteroidales bacterium]|nr:hypothetical protein [Bacteroidales bacterium]
MNKICIYLCILIYVTAVLACGNRTEVKEIKVEVPQDSIFEIPPIDTFSYDGFNSVAYILAGKQPLDSNLFQNVINSKEFANHKSLMENKWSTHKTKLDIITDWSNEHIVSADTVFYPFGGPDFNYLAAFFPDCRFSVLIGLEKGGKIPFSDSLSIAKYPEIFTAITSSVASNLEFSFFRTNSMARDLAGYLEGTLPIIMMFMSRHDFEIININPVFINNQGYFEYVDKERIYDYSLNKDFEDSFEIIYKKENEDFLRKLYYFSMDLCDSALNKQSFSLMMDNYFEGKTCFLKAASYLLDRPQFTIMKNLILDNCDVIITGPSGMPFKAFDNTWDIELFGNYIGPCSLFSGRQHPELKEAYEKGNPSPINFKFDYHATHHSLIIATKSIKTVQPK